MPTQQEILLAKQQQKAAQAQFDANQASGRDINGNVIPATYLQNSVSPVTLPNAPTPTPVQQFIAPPDMGKMYADLFKNSGIDQKATDVNFAQNAVTQEMSNLNDINAQLKGISDQGTQANLQLESGASGKDVTTQFLGRQQQEVSRQTAIKALPLQSQALASQAKVASLQGNQQLAQNLLSQAQNQINTLFSIQSKDAENNWKYQQAKIDAVYDVATKEQQAKLDAKKIADANNFQVQRDNINSAQSIAKTLMATQPQLASQITGLDPNSTGYTQELAKLLSTAEVDPMVALEVQNKVLGNQKLVAEINKINNGTGGGGSGGGVGGIGLSPQAQAVINGTLRLEDLTPTVRGQIAGELMSAGYQSGPKLTAAQQDDVSQMKTVDGLLDQILSYNNDGKLEGIGSFGLGSLKVFGAQLGFSSEEAKTVRTLIGNVKGTIAKLRGGTSFTTNEEKLLNSYTPTINDAPSVAINKINLLKQFIASKNANLISAATERKVPTKNADLRAKYNY